MEQYYKSSPINIDNVTIKYNKNGQLYCSSINDGDASSIIYLNGGSKLNAQNVQNAIDELVAQLETIERILVEINGE